MKFLSTLCAAQLLFFPLSVSANQQVLADTTKSQLLAVDSLDSQRIKEVSRKLVDRQKKEINDYLQYNKKVRQVVKPLVIAGLATIVGYGIYRAYVENPANAAKAAAIKKAADDAATKKAADEAAKAAAVAPKIEIPVKSEDVRKIKEQQEDIIKLLIAQRTELKDVRADYNVKLTIAREKEAAEVLRQAKLSWGRYFVESGKGFAFGTVDYAKQLVNMTIGNIPGSIASGLVGIVAFTMLPSIWEKHIGTRIGKIFHPLDSYWFITSRVQYDQMFENFEKTISELALSEEGFQRDYLVSSTIRDINIITDRLAKMIAFYEIQAERVAPVNKMYGSYLKNSSVYVFSLLLKFEKDMQKLLDTKNYVKIHECVITFQRQFKKEYVSYRNFERAALEGSMFE